MTKYRDPSDETCCTHHYAHILCKMHAGWDGHDPEHADFHHEYHEGDCVCPLCGAEITEGRWTKEGTWVCKAEEQCLHTVLKAFSRDDHEHDILCGTAGSKHYDCPVRMTLTDEYDFRPRPGQTAARSAHLRAAADELDEHHKDFAHIVEILDRHDRGAITPEMALLSIRQITGHEWWKDKTR